uniref:Uncharacterized protein n=3 Tax=Muroidea TaxID=337687 RepID=A0A8C6W875_NANGA
MSRATSVGDQLEAP